MRRVLLAMCIVVAGAACGSTSPSLNPLTGTVAVFGTNLHAFTATKTGTLTLTLTWADVTIDLDLYLAAATCQQLYPKANCNVLQSSRANVGVVTETVTQAVTKNDTFSVFVDNLDQAKQSAYSVAVKIQ